MEYKGTKNVYKSPKLNIDLEIYIDDNGQENVEIITTCLDNWRFCSNKRFNATEWADAELRLAYYNKNK